MEYRFIIQKRYVELLSMVGYQKTMKNLINKSGHTPRHISVVTSQWENKGLVTKKTKGREIEISITEIGKEFLELMDKIDKLGEKSKIKTETKSKEAK